MKKRLFSLLLAAVMLAALPIAGAFADEGASLDEALQMIDADSALSDRILLSDDFSRFDCLSAGEYSTSNGGFIVLWRNAPLKIFKTYETDFGADPAFNGEDDGEPEVFLCADVMKLIPSDLRAHSAAEVKNVIMVEKQYLLAGQISSVVGGGDNLPDPEDLEAIMNGESPAENREADENLTYNYRPVFTGLALADIYDADGGSAVLDSQFVEFTELRDNPEADDVWIQIKDLIAVTTAVAAGDAAPEQALEEAYHLSEEEFEFLSVFTDDKDLFTETCLEEIWESAAELKKADPDAGELYDRVIENRSLEGLCYLAGMRGYSGVTASDSYISGSKLYIGIPTDAQLEDTLGSLVDLFKLVEWDMSVLSMYL